MKCKWIFDGRVFLNEAELDEYLVYFKKLSPELGDIVFSRLSNIQRHILNRIRLGYNTLEDVEIVNEEVKGEPDDIDGVGSTDDYTSVSELIRLVKIINATGEEKLLSPKFVAENYWKELKLKYRTGNYDAKVLYQMLFLQDLVPNIGGVYLPVRDENTLSEIEKRMTMIWEQQAKCGDVVHALLAECYHLRKGETAENKGRWASPKEFSDLELREILTNKLMHDDHYTDIRKYAEPFLKQIIESTIRELRKIDAEIRLNFGENCMILSERRITGQAFDEENSTAVVGKMDLFVVSEDGKMGIFDFKCSPKDYSEDNYEEDPTKYDPAKVLTFKYQLAIYRRILAQMGVVRTKGLDEIYLGIIPLKFINYKYDKDKDQVTFEGVLTEPEEDAIKILPNSNMSLLNSDYSHIELNLDLIFPKEGNSDVITTDIYGNTEKNKKIMFSASPEISKIKTDEDVSNYINERNGLTKNKVTGNWEFKKSNTEVWYFEGTYSKREAEKKLIERVKNMFEYQHNQVANNTRSIRLLFEQSYESEEVYPTLDFSQFASKRSFTKDNQNYLNSQFGKYADKSRYELVDLKEKNDILSQLGIILFRNIHTGLIDVIRISLEYDPNSKLKFGSKNRTTIMGNFLADPVAKRDANIMEAKIGNMELMETLLILNEMSDLFDGKENSAIGRIKLISVTGQTGFEVTNELLLYNFDKLCKYGKIQHNFKTGPRSEGVIQMADRVSICKSLFLELVSKGENNLQILSGKFKDKVRSCISDFDMLYLENPMVLREKLIELDKILTGSSGIKGYGTLSREIGNVLDEGRTPEYELHRAIMYAITQLSGVNLIQQTEDHAKFSITHGTETDNPGTLESKTLNEFTNQVAIAYQNTRDIVIDFNLELRLKVEKLKKHKGFGLSKQYLAGNLVTALYKNMFCRNVAGDLLFVNPWDPNSKLDSEEREFLKFAILKILSNKGIPTANIEIAVKTDPTLLRVPLVKGDLTSQVSARNGWLNFIRDRFAKLNPKNLGLRFRDKMDVSSYGTITDQQKEQVRGNGEFWEAINTFDAGEDEEYRMKKLSDPNFGEPYFEHNIETLLLKHTSAYTMAEKLNDIFPVLRALGLHLTAQGGILNKAFVNDLAYVLRYVKTRIHNLPFEDRNDVLESAVIDVSKLLMGITSKLALAYNPRLLYQIGDGLWKDVQIYFRTHPDENTPFTKEGLIKALGLVTKDIRFGNNFTTSELLNLLYGLNDMDPNSYIDRIKTDNTGLLYHFWNVGYRFSSRPDFYNRMTLLYAIMIKDGSLEAHSIKDGKLIYDWTKDKRFDIYAKANGDERNVLPKDLSKFRELKSMYIAVAELMEREGVLDKNGNPFVLDIKNPKPLPKAYSNLLSENFKALTDRIYGYYSHEKKSLLHSTWIGSIFMQMNTYWSAKRNLYLRKRLYSQEGKWIDLVDEDGKKYCWVEDEDGQLIPKKIESEEDDNGVYVKVWQGLPQEGIIITLNTLRKAFFGKSDLTDKSGFEAISDIISKDSENDNVSEEERLLYIANLRQFLSDIIIAWIIGSLILGGAKQQAKKYVKERGNDTLGKGLTNSLILLSLDMAYTSTRDANAFESIFSRGKDWTPFSIKAGERTIDQAARWAFGKLDFFDFMTKFSSAGKSFLPFWESVKIKTFDEKIGE